MIGTLVLGALGSGLWEIVFKPIFKKLGELIFYVLTLGIKKSRDSVYLDAAKGHTEQGGIYVARHTSAIVSGLLITLAIVPFLILNGSTDLSKSVRGCDHHQESRDILGCKQQVANENLKELSIISTPLFLFVAVMLTYSSLRLSQVYRVTTDFNQYRTICKPHVQKKELHTIEKEFALMKNKNDYNVILKRLNKIAQDNGHELPRYRV